MPQLFRTGIAQYQEIHFPAHCEDISATERCAHPLRMAQQDRHRYQSRTAHWQAGKQHFLRSRYSYHGVNATHLASQVKADAIAGTCERFDVFEQVRHLHILSGQCFGNEFLALGMIYFLLLDLL